MNLNFLNTQKKNGRRGDASGVRLSSLAEGGEQAHREGWGQGALSRFHLSGIQKELGFVRSGGGRSEAQTRKQLHLFDRQRAPSPSKSFFFFVFLMFYFVLLLLEWNHWFCWYYSLKKLKLETRCTVTVLDLNSEAGSKFNTLHRNGKLCSYQNLI